MTPPASHPAVTGQVLEAPARFVLVDGVRVHYRRLGPRGSEPLVLVHGRAGHIGWWFGVAPLLAARHDVVVVDLSGHGDSGHRSEYDPTAWADEVAAVIDDVAVGPASVIGHSMGGHIAAYLAARSPEALSSLLLVDSRLNSEPYRAPAHNVVKVYGSLQEGLANFRLRPRSTIASPELLAEVGRYGLVEAEGGWRWKFDPGSGQPFTAHDIAVAIAGIACPVGLIYGEHSPLADEASADYLAARTEQVVPRTGIAGAYHHVPLDDPIACAEAISSLLAELT